MLKKQVDQQRDPKLWNALRSPQSWIGERRAYFFLGAAVIVYVIGVCITLPPLAPLLLAVPFTILLVFIPPLLPTLPFLLIAFRLWQKRAEEVLVDEEGTIVPFVLYLRPFRVRDLFATMNEEGLATAIKDIGIPVCVGRPGERLPPSGFHRLYFAESDWRDSVMAMAAESRCIAVLFAPGGNVVWEIDQVLKQWLFKTVLCIPHRAHARAREFLAQRGIDITDVSQHYSSDVSPSPFDICLVVFRSSEPIGSALRVVPTVITPAPPANYLYWCLRMIARLLVVLPWFGRYRWFAEGRYAVTHIAYSLAPEIQRLRGTDVRPSAANTSRPASVKRGDAVNTPAAQ